MPPGSRVSRVFAPYANLLTAQSMAQRDAPMAIVGWPLQRRAAKTPLPLRKGVLNRATSETRTPDLSFTKAPRDPTGGLESAVFSLNSTKTALSAHWRPGFNPVLRARNCAQIAIQHQKGRNLGRS